jgi:twitching motility protein PilI
LSLQALAEQPFELLVELERRARVAVAAREGTPSAADEWVGIGFRLGAERFVTTRGDVREVLPVPDQVTRVPGAKPWLRGIANLRGQLLTVVDLKSFLGAGSATTERHARVLVVASRDVPTGLIVDEVVGFRRFGANEYRDEAPAGVIRCEHYVEGCYRRGSEVWPRFSLPKLLGDEQFLMAGEPAKA